MNNSSEFEGIGEFLKQIAEDEESVTPTEHFGHNLRMLRYLHNDGKLEEWAEAIGKTAEELKAIEGGIVKDIPNEETLLSWADAWTFSLDARDQLMVSAGYRGYDRPLELTEEEFGIMLNPPGPQTISFREHIKYAWILLKVEVFKHLLPRLYK